MEENYLAQQPPWLINNAHYCIDEDSPTNNDNQKNNFLKYQVKHKNTKDFYTDRSKSMRRKVSFEETSISTVEMTSIKVPLKKIQKMGNIYRLLELYAVH